MRRRPLPKGVASLLMGTTGREVQPGKEEEESQEQEVRVRLEKRNRMLVDRSSRES